jgi:hypothetical protein
MTAQRVHACVCDASRNGGCAYDDGNIVMRP